MFKFILASIFAILFFTMCSVGYGRSYSDGDRTGIVYKFSHKGYVFKSWEGEILLGGARQTDESSVANVWKFTVVDSKLIKAVQDAQDSGKPMKAHYIQWAMSPIDMESDYELVSLSPTHN